MLFRPLRVFIPAMSVCLLYGLTKMTIDLIRDPMISGSATLALVSSLMILLVGMLGDALATRLGRLSPNVVGVRRNDVLLAEDEEEAVAPAHNAHAAHSVTVSAPR
jgi:hypothetical protein